MKPSTEKLPRVGPVILAGLLAAFTFLVSANPLATVLSGFAGVVIYWILWHLDRIHNELLAIRENLADRSDEGRDDDR
ncbi:MAG: hypothetical protein ACE10M_09940 [Alphaproteobacteria bacterium]